MSRTQTKTPAKKRVRRSPGEFQLIDLFVRELGAPPAPRGPGDDCAVLPTARGSLCVTTDAVVEDVHFTRATFSAEDVGHKALAVNLSDLAAMGATPAWFLCALALPEWADAAYVRRLGRGMARLARATKTPLVGGNVTSASELSLTLTVAGTAPPTGALLRSRARPGDVLYVSGTLGGARLGLLMLSRSEGAELTLREQRSVLERQRRPTPRLALGRLAARFASACIDLSDGLAQDLGHLCRASGCAADLEDARLPIEPSVVRMLGDLATAADFALAGGEDYELLLAVPSSRAAAFERACTRAGEPVTEVGKLRRGSGVARVGIRGSIPQGFDHLRSRTRRSEESGL